MRPKYMCSFQAKGKVQQKTKTAHDPEHNTHTKQDGVESVNLCRRFFSTGTLSWFDLNVDGGKYRATLEQKKTVVQLFRV